MTYSQILRPNGRLKAKIIPVEPFTIVVFGGTGDLALRKLMPALYYRDKDRQIPDDAKVIGVSRSSQSRDEYIALIEKHLRMHVPAEDWDESVWTRFSRRVDFKPVDANDPKTWAEIASLLKDDARIRVYYLSTPPDLFQPICLGLRDANMINDRSRIVLEKPIGRDLKTAEATNNAVGEVFREDQTYRIDHYLGKETVQNLMALRFANSLFEPLWNRNWIDHIQITVAESIGIGDRGNYYDRAGALRDMVQNHLLQLLCLVAMEPPRVFHADAVRDEKLKALRALRPFHSRDVKGKLVLGQYASGAVDGQPVPSYLAEKGVAPDSQTETFMALKAEVDNWRWEGVPFYLRTGKRMPQRISEITIEFKPVPHLIFPDNKGQVTSNLLVIRLQPDEGIRLFLMSKVPGPGGFRMQVAPLNLSFAETFKTRYPDGYERLVMDVVRGNPTLFMRRDEVEAAWKWTDTVLAAWEDQEKGPFLYTAGSWGPSAAVGLITRDGKSWFQDGA